MKQSKQRKRRTAAAMIAGTAAVVAVAGGVTLFGIQNHSSAPIQATEIPMYAPADSDTFVIAPFSANWWAKVSAMAPQELMLQGLTPPDGLKIEQVGYSRSQDTTPRAISGTGPLRVFYIEATTETEMGKVREWLSGASGYDHRILHQEGKVLVITEAWVPDYPVPAKSMMSVASFNPAVTDQQAAMWYSPQLEVASLAGPGDSEKATALSTYLQKGFGFTPGTAWSGTSRDGDMWSGKFATGGVDPAQIDFTQATSAMMSQRKVLASAKDANGKNSQSSYQVVDPGVSAALSAASVSVAGQSSPLGARPPSNAVPAVRDAKVTAAVDVTAWDRAVSGNLAVSESVLTRSLSANTTDMNISFVYASPK
ncbi:hypothetical protein [Arthrobacter terrae]|nr:hypothetical protein [Arthrobacter terrae]